MLPFLPFPKLVQRAGVSCLLADEAMVLSSMYPRTKLQFLGILKYTSEFGAEEREQKLKEPFKKKVPTTIKLLHAGHFWRNKKDAMPIEISKRN